MIPCELDLTTTPFFYTKILTYEIDLPPSENKIGFILLNDEKFTIPYVTDTMPNSSLSHKLPTQAKKNVWIISINVEETITYQCVLDEFNVHLDPRGKYKVNISLCRRKSYQSTYIENICSRFDQVRPVISHI